MNKVFINHRAYTFQESLSQELNFSEETNYLFDLSYLNALEVHGERAQEFLQGQLTCDLRQVNQQHIQRGALCNLKGRILALMDVVQQQNYYLMLPQDLMQDTFNSLSKTALLSRVKIVPQTRYLIFGFYYNDPSDQPPFNILSQQSPLKQYSACDDEHGFAYAIHPKLYIFFVASEIAEQLIQSYPLEQRRGSLAWHWLQLKHSNLEIYPESRGLFLPHRLDLHHQGYLSFDKGCYKGQEIIARTHYRATLKHTMKQFILQSFEPLRSGQKIFDAEHRTEIGELIDYCPIGENQYLIAISALFEHSSTVVFEQHETQAILE